MCPARPTQGVDVAAAKEFMENLTINEAISAVPEPSTWAMLLLGFAALGLMAYRRNAKPAWMAA